MKWPLMLACFLLSCILDASHADCSFPPKWNGHWFLSGNPEVVTVNGSMMTSKGICLESSEDEFFIFDRDESCYRCIVMHMKHINVLQYKETFCMKSPKQDLATMCNQLQSDATLVSLFRTGAAPMPCPFKGPLEFSYSHGENECNTPQSTAETCIQDSRLLLRYQACANLLSSERVDVELECLATWKEGSTYYLVARLHRERKTIDEDSYRCFIYEQTSNTSWNLAQSADASCTGLSSVKESAKTFKMRQKNAAESCMYPSWVVENKLWMSLDLRMVGLYASPHNLTLLDQRETRLVCHSLVTNNDRHSHHPVNPDRENQVQYIAKATVDCTNGYVCLMFHRRDNHIIEMQLSDWSQQPDDVCNSSTFNSHSTPYTTFITPDPITRQCPNLGRYEIVSVLRFHNNDKPGEILGMDGEQGMVNVAEVQDVRVTSTPYPGRCRYGSVRRLDIGCKIPDRMEFATSCSDESLPSEYLCHGTWIENDTAYLVASTDMNRYCLVYSASATATGNRELSVTGHLASCPRAFHHHVVSWQFNLTSYAQCADISMATSWTLRISASVYVLAVIGTLFGRYIAR